MKLTTSILENYGFKPSYQLQEGASWFLGISGRMQLVYSEGDPSCLSIFQDEAVIDLPHGVCDTLDKLKILHESLTGKPLL